MAHLKDHHATWNLVSNRPREGVGFSGPIVILILDLLLENARASASSTVVAQYRGTPLARAAPPRASSYLAIQLGAGVGTGAVLGPDNPMPQGGGFVSLACS